MLCRTQSAGSCGARFVSNRSASPDRAAWNLPTMRAVFHPLQVGTTPAPGQPARWVCAAGEGVGCQRSPHGFIGRHSSSIVGNRQYKTSARAGNRPSFMPFCLIENHKNEYRIYHCGNSAIATILNYRYRTRCPVERIRSSQRNAAYAGVRQIEWPRPLHQPQEERTIP